MKEHNGWRFETLARLAAAIVDVEGSSRRIRWTPSPRTLRYYTTLGLLDRPLYFEGRTAFYGRKHLAQIVVIKKLQANGASLAEVQQHLAGLPDQKLFELARLPDPLPDMTTDGTSTGATTGGTADSVEKTSSRPPYTDGDRDRFWTATPVGPATPIDPDKPGSSTRPQTQPQTRPQTSTGPSSLGAGVYITIAPGVILFIEGRRLGLTADEIDEIRAAAGPLLGLLSQTRAKGRDDDDQS